MVAERRITSLQRALAQNIYQTNPDLTLKEIAEATGMSARSVARLAREGNWVRASFDADSAISADSAGQDAEHGAGTDHANAPAPGRGADNRAALIDELWLAVRRHVADLGGHPVGGHPLGGLPMGGMPMDGAIPGSQAGARPDGQAITALMNVARTIEKLTEMERGAADMRAPADEGPEDIDEFRNEIARRLEGLLGSRPDRSGGGADPDG